LRLENLNEKKTEYSFHNSRIDFFLIIFTKKNKNSAAILNYKKNRMNATTFTHNYETPSIGQLFDSLGFDMWKIVTLSFVLPTISLIGIFLCSLSAWIFLQKKFKDPVFFYYRLVCISSIIHLIHNLPLVIFFLPLYFPNFNTYLSTIYIIYSSFVLSFFFHFEETLQMFICI
jgi:hypothetical protein